MIKQYRSRMRIHLSNGWVFFYCLIVFFFYKMSYFLKRKKHGSCYKYSVSINMMADLYMNKFYGTVTILSVPTL